MAACQAVLDTYELLENIITNVPALHIRKLKRIDKSWEKVIRNSHAIRCARCVNPVFTSDPGRVSLLESRVPPQMSTSIHPPTYPDRGLPCYGADTHIEINPNFHYMVTVNSNLGPGRDEKRHGRSGDWIDDLDEETHRRITYSVDLEENMEAHQAKCGTLMSTFDNQYITSPPISSMDLIWCRKGESTEVVHFEPVQCSQGITVRQARELVESLRRQEPRWRDQRPYGCAEVSIAEVAYGILDSME